MDIRGDDYDFDGTTARELIETFGSPLYVYEEPVIRRQARALKAAFSALPVQLHYACKANTNLHLMRLLREEGLHVDCVSVGEILAAQKAGYATDEITFTGNNVTPEDMAFVRDKGILPILDSVDQVQRWGSLAPKSRIGVRLNHLGAGHHDHVITGGPDSKFGIVRKDYDALKAALADHDLTLTGVHQHIGSGILQAEDWILAMNVLIDSLKEFPPLEWVDFGGGLGVPSAPGDEPIDLPAVAAALEARWRQEDPEGRMIINMQPGRFLVAESGWLLMTVQSIKSTEKHTFVGTDSGFHHHIRHPLYKAYNPIGNATGATREPRLVAVAGNICESGDLFTHGREIAEPRVGDVLALGLAGAYGFSMASRYNSRPLPAEVLTRPEGPMLIRTRECYDRLFEDQENVT